METLLALSDPFAVSIDYVLDSNDDLAVLYHVALSNVAAEIYWFERRKDERGYDAYDV